MMSAVMPNIVMLSVVILNVMAPASWRIDYWSVELIQVELHSKDRLQALATNVKLDWKCLPGANALALAFFEEKVW